MITTTPVGLGFSGIATGASIGGNTDGLTSAEKFEAQQAQIARDFSAFEAQKQRDFEERLSSTARL